MPPPDFQDPRLTEQRNPRTAGIDVASAQDIVDLLNDEDQSVAHAVRAQRVEIARAAELVLKAFQAGGRLLYLGAGTSGRLGVLDAAECPPTFGTSPEMVRGIIAGGPDAMFRSQEGAEDDRAAAEHAVEEAGVSSHDVVLGIAASGTTPFVHAGLERAARRGASTVLCTCSDPPRDLATRCDVVIAVRTGPEALTGSTRLKAGTATKLVLNTITTAAMIRLGKCYGNLMVDLMAWSEKLRDRGERIVMETCRVSRTDARRAIEAAGGSVKLAIVMIRKRVDRASAESLLVSAGGLVRRVVGDPPPVG
ncbi:MAG TPA: N-acetylmuramic acid 6-phosphate etherase [Gemmatimonadales bacterium]|nr:N-acetylmuramic acid 6-phosphate etherase [Gemmatimonadales bacterium]